MKIPHDSSDIASLIWADWHEEFGNQSYSDEIRLSVNEPNVSQWQYEYRQFVIGVIGGIGSDVGSYVGDGGSYGGSVGDGGSYVGGGGDGGVGDIGGGDIDGGSVGGDY